jgi:hypothetical protein
MTSSGKTTLAKHLCREYRKRGYGCLVLDPLLDSGWDADLVTDDSSKFLASAQKSKGCKLFLDESGETVGRYNDEMFWLATRARHSGHQSHFMSQRVVQLNRTVRDQCSNLFAFRISTLDAKTLAIDWSDESLMLSSSLEKFAFIHTSRFGKAERYMVTRTGVIKHHGIVSSIGNSSGLSNYQ